MNDGDASHVSTTLRALMKGVQANGELDEADLDDAVCRSCAPCSIEQPLRSATGEQGERQA